MEDQLSYLKMMNLRTIRSTLLFETDSTIALIDFFSSDEIENIKQWRQKLRDLPGDVDIANVIYGDTFSGIPGPPQVLIDKKHIFSNASIIRRFLEPIETTDIDTNSNLVLNSTTP